jgi:hypothetical protein
MNTWTLTKDPNKDYFQSYKGRMIDPAKICRVYRNLHNDMFSIQQYNNGRWQVVGHARSIRMKDCRFHVSQTGRMRVIQEKKKYVHAFVLGFVHSTGYVPSDQDMKYLREITYNPYTLEYFVYKDSAMPHVRPHTLPQLLLTHGKVYDMLVEEL